MSHMAAAWQVFMFAFSSCYSTELKRSMGPGEICKLSFRSYIVRILLCIDLAKTDAEICNTYPLVGFSFLWPTGETSGGLLTCT